MIPDYMNYTFDHNSARNHNDVFFLNFWTTVALTKRWPEIVTTAVSVSEM